MEDDTRVDDMTPVEEHNHVDGPPMNQGEGGLGIVLVSQEERFRMHFPDQGDAWIDYRRVPMDKLEEIKKKNTRRGELDGDASSIESLEYAILGWGNIRDAAGHQAPFRKELIASLPLKVRILAIKQVFGTVGGEAADADPLEIFGSTSAQ